MLGEPRTSLILLFSARHTFWKNPQFLLSIWRPKESRTLPMPCSVLVSLIQKPRHRHRNRKPPLAIGFYLFRVGGHSGMHGHIWGLQLLSFLPVSYPRSAHRSGYKFWLCPLGICDLEQVISLTGHNSFLLCEMGTQRFMQTAEGKVTWQCFSQFTINASVLFLSKKAKVGLLHPFPEFLMMD